MLQVVTILNFNALCYGRRIRRGSSSSFTLKNIGKIRGCRKNVSFSDYRFACNICNKFFYFLIKDNTDKDYSLLHRWQNMPGMLHFCNKLLQVVTNIVTKQCNKAQQGFQRFVTTFCLFSGFAENTFKIIFYY